MLSGQKIVFKAVDTIGKDQYMGKKALENMMAPETLEFKKGSQVMLIKNFDEGLVNGSLGKIQAFMTQDIHNYWKENEEEFEEIWGDEEDEEKRKRKQEIRSAMRPQKKDDLDSAGSTDQQYYPLVRFSLPDGTFRTMLCTPEDWRVEGNTKDELIANRRQVPLILAWALSIHKAQGQTLERVKVNLGRVFEKGQAYVALSRATSQSGLQVMNFHPSKVMVHQKVIGFYDKLKSVHALGTEGNETAKKKVVTAKDYEKTFVELSEDDDELYMYE